MSNALDTAALSSLFPSTSAYAAQHAWVPLAAAALLGLGQETHVAELCGALLSLPGEDEVRLMALRRLREAMLKASPLVGFPRSINGLTALREELTSHDQTLASVMEEDRSLRSSVPLATRQIRGLDFFRRIYAQHADRVLADLNACSGGDLGEFAINCVYGDLVAEESILGAKETGLLEFVCCLTLGAGPQAKGHMYGARNLGNSGTEVVAATELVEAIAKQLDAPWSREGMAWLEKASDW